MKSKFKLSYILFLIPAVLGFFGFLQIDGISVTWALYYTLRLFGLNTDTNKINILIEIARWTAPLVTAGVIIFIFKSFREFLKNYLRSKKGGSISVYGDGQRADDLLCNLGKNGIRATANNIYKTKNHIIIFDDEEKNLDFYIKNDTKLLPFNVYISLDEIKIQNINKKNIFPFFLNENFASVYWSKYPATPNEKISIIGNCPLVNSMLDKALLVNILSLSQNIEYHIFKENNEYPHIKTKLNKITMDTINFHSGKWYENFEILLKSDRIIVCEDGKESLSIASKLLHYSSNKKIYIYAKSDDFVSVFFNEENIIPFGMSKDLITKDIIINEKLLENAKKLHNHYYELYGGSTWNELEEFKKFSSISSASYNEVICRLYSNGVDIETLAHLEHIRWCRFHYLNNWDYGKERDNNSKIHNLLIDYDKLDEIEKQKDRDVIKLALNNERN